MPGQRKRKQRRQRQEFAAGAGRWDDLRDPDPAEWRARLARLRAGDEPVDWSAVRVDTLCGRSTRPTTYRLSRFVPFVPGEPEA